MIMLRVLRRGFVSSLSLSLLFLSLFSLSILSRGRLQEEGRVGMDCGAGWVGCWMEFVEWGGGEERDEGEAATLRRCSNPSLLDRLTSI